MLSKKRLVTTCLLLLSVYTYAIDTDTIPINGNGSGRVFEGIGAVSAGGASRMLIDYPAARRSDILDYLFKPNFGAGFIYLKTEIGGDGNSTCGAEPSFARTRAEMAAPNYNRGYEYWLMREAANRNPNIELDALEWSMPGWFNGTWSADNAAYLVKFIEGARHWGLPMKYIGGCWNEREYNRNWIVDTLRPLLNKSGFSHIGINAPEGAGNAWAICDELIKDTAFRHAVAAVSYHYPDSYMWREGTSFAGKNAFECGVPLWSGEDFSLGGKSWKNTMYLALNILKCYLKQKIVKVNVWCPIASMPDNACFSSVGMMKGVSPWSGYYEVWPTIWAVAHFNQFVQPGWQYLDDGCGWLPGNGAYCTYKRPGNQGDYSIVAVTGNLPKKITFKTTHLSGSVVHVWKSDSTRQLIRLADIKPVNGVFTIQLDAASIYSLTTTTGQRKGAHTIPPATDFPSTYKDNFDQYTLNQAPMSPRYFYDNSGAFEIYQAAGESKCLRQMLNNDITHWIPDECAYTFVAQGTEWENGEVAADVLAEENAFNGTGYAGVIIRASYDKSSQAKIPLGYRLSICKDNTWKLQTKTQTLAEGRVDANTWHRLRLRCNADSIQAFIDGHTVASIQDKTYLLGATGFTSGWNKAKFDNAAFHYVPFRGRLLSDWKVATASVESPGQEAVNAFDGNSLSKWWTGDTPQAQWLMVDLGRPCNITRCETFTDLTDKPAHYKLEYSTDKVHWQLFADRTRNNDVPLPCFVDLHKATGRWVRITVLPAAEKAATGIYALKVYGY